MLRQNFIDLAFKINSALGKKIPIKTLFKLAQEKVCIAAGNSCHYKINTDDERVPLKIKINVTQGVGYGYLSISQRFERPNKEHCDKVIKLTAKEMSFTFYGINTLKKKFTIDFAYITVESEHYLSLSLECCFGLCICFKLIM